jgi:hypothetical protein
VVDGNPQRRVAADFRYDVVLRRHISARVRHRVIGSNASICTDRAICMR